MTSAMRSMPRLPAVSATFIPGVIVLLISARWNSAATATATSRTWTELSCCRTFTQRGNVPRSKMDRPSSGCGCGCDTGHLLDIE
jgi:hypothetical protein